MGYWKSKVLPKIKKVFENPKKAGAADFCKSFDGNKEEYTKVFEEKKTEFHAKVVEIHEASPAEIKDLIKEPKEAGLKKNSTGVQTFLDELAKIEEFPGSKAVSEASSKFGPALVQGPIFFIFEKVSTFIVTEEKPVEPPPEAAAAAPPAAEEEGTSKEKDKEIVVEVEEKKEEAVAAVVEEEEKTVQPPAEPPKAEEPPKEEDPSPAPAEPPKP